MVEGGGPMDRSAVLFFPSRAPALAPQVCFTTPAVRHLDSLSVESRLFPHLLGVRPSAAVPTVWALRLRPGSLSSIG